MPKPQNRRQVALLPTEPEDSILLPDDAGAQNSSSSVTGHVVVTANRRPTRGIMITPPPSSNVIIAPPSVSSLNPSHLASRAANVPLPVLQRCTASSIEVTPGKSGPRKVLSPSPSPSPGKSSPFISGDPSRSSTGARKNLALGEGVSTDEDSERNLEMWRKKQKKQRTLLIDESKLIHDYNKKLIECSLCRRAIASSQLRQVQSN